jgi:hypothetical protein
MLPLWLRGNKKVENFSRSRSKKQKIKNPKEIKKKSPEKGKDVPPELTE